MPPTLDPARLRLLPLLALLLNFPAAPRAAVIVAAETIRVPADRLPESGAHTPDDQENRISQVVRTMHQDGSGDLWFGTQRGLLHHDGTGLAYYDLRDEYDQRITAHDFAETPDGTLWIATTGGLTRYDGTSFTSYFTADGLPDRDAWTVCVDRRGDVWVGTYEGACRFDGATFTPFPLPETTERDPRVGVWGPRIVWQIHEDRRGDLWFVTESGFYRYDGTSATRVPMGNGDSEVRTGGLLEDRHGDFWISARHDGLIRFDGETFTDMSEAWGLPEGEVYRPYEDRDGVLWFIVENAGVYHYDGTSLTRLSAEDGFPGGAVHFVFQDADNRHWFGGFEVLARRDGEAFVHVTRDGPW